MADTADTGPLGRAIHETLESVASPAVRDRVLASALHAAKAQRVPEDATRARAFVEGPLRREVARLLGRDVAEVIVADLGPLLERAGGQPAQAQNKGVRTTSEDAPTRRKGGLASETPFPFDAATLPRQAQRRRAISGERVRQDGWPLVLMATQDRSGVQRMARHLLDHALVQPVHDVSELVQQLERRRAGSTSVVIVDCCVPVVEPEAVASMLEGLDELPYVVLWGATAGQSDRMGTHTRGARQWIPLAMEAGDQEVAELIATLLPATEPTERAGDAGAL